ncbi:uncharacterized protein PG998_007973 [Apiospora kogelbergensis]|uniref:Uncharacterized protein n=1 Tax=Apiospora kogelbergensis TaxID=1337665 RepID=A0AAW0QEF4_9PEZI
MQFLSLASLAALALAGFATAQSDSEVGMVCPDLYGPQNPSKKDPNGWWITEPSMCESIGGKLYADDVICCPKSDAEADIVPYLNKCNSYGGTMHWPLQYENTKFEIVPPGWKCPK